MEHQRFFEDAFRHAFSSLPPGSVFDGKFRESKFTKHMKNGWQRPDGFETLLIGKDLAHREVDFTRKIDGKFVASCDAESLSEESQADTPKQAIHSGCRGDPEADDSTGCGN
jgi:hypothetical protein